MKSIELGIIGVLAAIAVLAGLNEIYVLFGAGLIGIILHLIKTPGKAAYNFFPFIFLQISHNSIYSSPFKLFLVISENWFLSFTVAVMCSFAFLDAELVSKGLLTKQQLIDAIAVGQFTPGPVFSSATFIGWQIGGATGAIASTIGIFFPSFLFVALLNPLIPKLRKSTVMSAFLDIVNIVSEAIILSVIVEIGRATLLDWKTIVIAVISFIITFYFKKMNTVFIIAGGALLGYILSFA